MQFFNESHELARQTVRRFVATHILPHVDDWEEQQSFPRTLYQEAGRAGILGIGYPEEWGGSGEGDVFLKIAASEELMRSTSGGLVASLGSLDIALPPILRWGSAALKDRVLKDVLAGNKVAALAITEPGGGSDVANLKTRAVDKGDHFLVSGTKTFITSGIRADFYTVAVRTGSEGHGGISLLLIEKGTPGFETGRNLKKMGWWASDTAELFFSDCQVPKENLIGPLNTGFLAIMSNFLSERLALAVMGYMAGQLALEKAMEYAKQREAFGRPIARFQSLKHKLVDMESQVDIARQYTYHAASLVQAGKNPIKEVSIAKNFAAQCAENVCREAIQIFGGMGYMRETGVERLYRDARLLAIGGGTTEIMNEIIAKQMGLG